MDQNEESKSNLDQNWIELQARESNWIVKFSYFSEETSHISCHKKT